MICITGAFAALTVSMFGSMFPMPRIAYAMAKDGLLFKFLAKVNSRGVPAWANLWLGLISAFCALIFSLEVSYILFISTADQFSSERVQKTPPDNKLCIILFDRFWLK